jgi:hypothetical protein
LLLLLFYAFGPPFFVVPRFSRHPKKSGLVTRPLYLIAFGVIVARLVPLCVIPGFVFGSCAVQFAKVKGFALSGPAFPRLFSKFAHLFTLRAIYVVSSSLFPCAGAPPAPTLQRYRGCGPNTQIAPQTRKGITSGGKPPPLRVCVSKVADRPAAVVRCRAPIPPRPTLRGGCSRPTAPAFYLCRGFGRAPLVPRPQGRAGPLCAKPWRGPVPALAVAPCGRFTRQKFSLSR